MKAKRATCVQPEIVVGVDLGFEPPCPVVQPKLEAWEITRWRDVDIEANPHLKAKLPNCPDGRYR